MSLSLGAFFGWLTASLSQPTSSHLSLWSGWSIGFLVVFVIGVALWLHRGKKRNAKNPEGIDIPEVAAKVDEGNEGIATIIKILTTRPQLEVAIGDQIPMMVGNSYNIPPGATVVSGTGAGPLEFTVPNGILGSGPTGLYTFMVPADAESIVLPDGGIVTAFEG